jgi:protease-4
MGSNLQACPGIPGRDRVTVMATPLAAARSRVHDVRHPAPLLLELDLTADLLDDVPSDPLSALQARRRTPLRAVLDNLHDAADDPRVAGVVARVGGRPSLARVQELADAVREFRRHGKPAVAWAETFGEFGPGTSGYVLATAFDEIWLQPSGDVGLLGVAAGAWFLREALDRAGVEPQLDRRYEYKNAADLLLSREFRAAHREATARLAASAFEQVVAAIATGRGLAAADVRSLVDRAPLMAQEALDAGLVDRLGYRDEVYADLRRRLGDDGTVRLLYVGRYERRHRLPERVAGAVHRDRPVVALVHGSGASRQGRSGRSYPTGAAMGSETVAAALRAATAAGPVKAIVFRVNSPGGSYVASDTIWREVACAREAGKPVVVSMGDVAGSGGYFVACGADAIVAQPGTLTGSIGVVGGKAVLTGLRERLGIGHGTVTEGRHALMFSAQQEFSAEEWQRLQDWLDRVYDDFTAKVAAGRGMSREQVHEVARGRVWTGADARERGLVDELGGLHRAAEIACERADLPAETELRRYPSVGLPARLRRPRSSEDPAAAAAMHLPWGSFTDLATVLGLPAAGPLTMPGLRLT